MKNTKAKIISDAIKKADSTYFFEDYGKQAVAVMKALEKSGYKIVKSEPTKEMIKQGVWAINMGQIDARELAKDVYLKMIETNE
jgi:hypothetical protein